MPDGGVEVRSQLTKAGLGSGGKGAYDHRRPGGEGGKNVCHKGAKATFDAIANHGASYCPRNSETGHALGIAGHRQMNY